MGVSESDPHNIDGYCPSYNDILFNAYKTTGIHREKFEFKQQLFHVLDVGGQKNERKKWMYPRKWNEESAAVIFVASLSCYNQVLYEDFITNSLADQMNLFEEICNKDWLENVKMILVFTHNYRFIQTENTEYAID